MQSTKNSPYSTRAIKLMILQDAQEYFLICSRCFDTDKKPVCQWVCQYGAGGHDTPSQCETTAKHAEFTLFCVQRAAR